MFKKIINDKAIYQIVLFAVLVLLFLIVNSFISGGYNIHSSLDYRVPFIPIFVVPYFLWYIYIVAAGIILYMKAKEDFRRTFLMINICMAAAIIIYIIFPNYQSLRPMVYGSDFFSKWVKLLQNADSASSVCPSLHVAVSVCLYSGLANSLCCKDNSKVKFFTFLLTALISISTIFIKQHSIIDVVFGVLLAWASYVFVYKLYLNEKPILREISKEGSANLTD